MPVVALAAYVIIVLAASGTLSRRRAVFWRVWRVGRGKGRIDWRNGFAWAAALLSTFGLPWSGVPFSRYFGAGSQTWFTFAAASLVILRGDGRPGLKLGKFFALLNPAAIVVAIFYFMLRNGVPGDIPGIEGIAAINSLEGLLNWRLTTARGCFFASAVMSFLPVYRDFDSDARLRAIRLLSFSYSSFLAIAFLPPARMFFAGLRPETAILADAAGYFVCAFLIHTLVMGSLRGLELSRGRYSYYAANAALTVAGVITLSTVVKLRS